MRKVVGATRKALVVQFVAEALAIALAAGLVAGALIELSMPVVSAVLGETIRIRYLGAEGIALPLLGLSLVVGLASGVYPALVLANYRPAAVLASARAPGGGRRGARMREILALGQFAAAICLMVCTAVIFAQIRFVHQADIGFRRDGLIIVQMGDAQVAKDKRALLQAFRGLPGVLSATASTRRPATDQNSSTNVGVVGNGREEPSLVYEWIGPDYARTLGLTMLAGRALGSDQRMDDKASAPSDQFKGRSLNAMINRRALVALGFAGPRQAIGQRIRVGDGRAVNATIVGVAADVRFLSPHDAAEPQFYMQDSGLGRTEGESAWSAAMRVRDGDEAAVMRRIADVWRAMEPGTPLQARTAPAALQPYYDPDARRGQLFAVGAGLSCVIACLGLFGLAAFNTSRRYKEIGIRKTLGASTADVARLLIGEFLRPVLWANLIAWPLAFFAMRAWLAGFDQRIDLTPAAFLIASALAIVVAVATVASQTLRVARAEPATALRYE
jgi:putative ABC transport system permease protein